MPLPADLIDMIFTKMMLVYGREFTARWTGVDMALVKGDWAHELRFLSGNLQAIRYGLEHLPTDKPPTVLQFRRMCGLMPPPSPVLLPPPVYTPEQVKARVASLRALSTRMKNRFNRVSS